MRRIPIALLLLGLSCADPSPRSGVLYDFETDADLDRIVWNCHTRFSLSTEHASSGSRSLRCDFGEFRYPGISFHDFPADLGDARSISIDLFNDSTSPINLVVRIDDADSGSDHDNRYNGSFLLRPGATSVVIPLEEVRNAPEGRKLDLSKIEQFLIFLYQIEEPVTIYVDRIALK